jgi:O-antigen/teichoic acid export membrane protein
MAAGDHGWVRTALRRSILWSFAITAIPGAVVVALGPQLFRLWVGDQVQSDRALLAGLAAWTVVSTLGAALSVALNAGGLVAFQVATASAMGVVSVAAKIIGVRAFGLVGVIWPTVLVYTIISLIPTALYVSRRVGMPLGSA